MLGELEFSYSLSELFTKLTAAFQKSEPLVHSLHADLQNLLLTVLVRPLKLNILMSLGEISTFSHEKVDNCL